MGATVTARREWGLRGAPCALLVHGAGAHAGWWDPVAPALLQAGPRHLVAIELAGHGDAPRRAPYSLAGWASSLQPMSTAVGMSERPVLIAHSLGGVVALLAAQDRPDAWGGLVVIDSPIERTLSATTREADTPTRRGSRDEILDRFRLVPPQPSPGFELMQTLAAGSIRMYDDGWGWKFDPRIFTRSQDQSFVPWGDIVDALGGRVSYIVGEHSTIAGELEREAARNALGAKRVVVIPGGHHHVLLDSPDALAHAVRAQTREWWG